jgi:hypothetical protein
MRLVVLPVCSSPSSDVSTTGLEPGMPLKHPRTTQDLVPRRIVESLWGSPWHFIQDWYKVLFTPVVAFSDPLWKSPQVIYTTPNKRVEKLPTSTQLRATWHTNSLDMVVLPSTGALSYHNCCIDGETSPEYFRNYLVCVCIVSFSGALAELPKATTSFVLSGRLSVWRTITSDGTVWLPMDWFSWKQIFWELLRKFVQKIQVYLKSDKKNGYFLWRNN